MLFNGEALLGGAGTGQYLQEQKIRTVIAG